MHTTHNHSLLLIYLLLANMSLPDRFEKVETAVKSLTESQAAYKPLNPLISDVDSLLKAEQLLTAYRKKLADLTQASEEGKTRLQALGGKVRTMVGSADQTLADLIAKRQKEVRYLEAKAANVENLYEQLLHEGQIAAKQLQVALKQEAIEVASAFDRRLVEERATLLQRLERVKTINSEAVAVAREEAKRAIQELSEYGKDNGERMGDLQSITPASQSSRISSEEAKSTILTEVNSRLNQGMQAMRDHMESKCRAIGWHYSGEMLRLRGEVESTRETLIAQRGEKDAAETNPAIKLKWLNEEARMRLSHLNAYCAKGLLNICELAKAAHHALSLAETEGISDSTRPQLLESRKQVQYSFQQATDIAAKAKAHSSTLQDIFQQAKAASNLKGVKLTPEKKAVYDSQRDIRSRLEKEVIPIPGQSTQRPSRTTANRDSAAINSAKVCL
jgi:hypothetical protein